MSSFLIDPYTKKPKKDSAQIAEFSATFFEQKCELYTLEGAEAFSIVEQIGTDHAAHPDSLTLAFDNRTGREKGGGDKIYHSALASFDKPQGFKVTFEKETRLHELTIVPRLNLG